MAKQVKLSAIHPNAGLELAFQRKLDALIDDMQASLVHWLTAAYRANKPAMAADAEDDPRDHFIAEAEKTTSQVLAEAIDASGSTATVLQGVMRKLARKWNRKFAESAKPMADYYAKAAKDRTDGALRAALKKAGMTVKFTMTPQIQDIITATVSENVSLIKSIASEHLADVEQMVMRSVTVGRDLGGLREALQDRYGITKRRAQLIARQSNNNASAMIKRAREDELGVTEAEWIHSNAGREPRHEHVGWNGKTYNIKTGMWSEVSGKYVWPGSDFNCRCFGRSILPAHIQKTQAA